MKLQNLHVQELSLQESKTIDGGLVKKYIKIAAFIVGVGVGIYNSLTDECQKLTNANKSLY